MNFDIPKTPKPWENKKSIIFSKWLAEQANLAPENWSADFNAYVEKINDENNKEWDDQEHSVEQEKERTFKRYLSGLKLTEQDLIGKSILDVGCHDGAFLVSCLEKNLAQKAYGTDCELEGEASQDKYHGNFFVRDFADDLPVAELDYVVSVGALSLFLDEEHKDHVEKSIAKCINAICKNGEVRIWPIKKALRGKEMAGIIEGEKVILEIMAELEEQAEIQWELNPSDIRVDGKEKDVWLEQVLIIKKVKLEAR